MDKWYIRLLKLTIIAIIITMLWQFIEVLFIGHTNPNGIDTIIAILLTYSIYLNLQHNKKYNKNNTEELLNQAKNFEKLFSKNTTIKEIIESLEKSSNVSDKDSEKGENYERK